ncbi:uncharacterized protein LOC142490158 isoform X1 [Ascaphus truei]|uniref:uncharacterized protein LOC142489232 isoform X1 n=1 Tax=Ascaphus truei TaxID=8439 RepID=UPI003F592BFD
MSSLFIRSRHNVNVDHIFSDPNSVQGIESVTEDFHPILAQLEKTLMLESKQWWEATTLSKYLENHRIPRGLRVRKKPTGDAHNEGFMREWNEILDQCSFSLMKLLVHQRRKTLAELDGHILDMKIQLDPYKDNKELLALEPTIKKRLDQAELEIVQIKQQKFFRDKQDYDTGCQRDWAKKSKEINAINVDNKKPNVTIGSKESNAKRSRYIQKGVNNAPKKSSSNVLVPTPFVPVKQPLHDKNLYLQQKRAKERYDALTLPQSIPIPVSNRYTLLSDIGSESDVESISYTPLPTPAIKSNFSFLEWRKERDHIFPEVEIIKHVSEIQPPLNYKKRKTGPEGEEEVLVEIGNRPLFMCCDLLALSGVNAIQLTNQDFGLMVYIPWRLLDKHIP